MQETRVWSLGWRDPLEKWDLPTSIFSPGESHGQSSLVGYSPWGCKESDTTERLTRSLFSQVPKGEEINTPLLKADLNQSYLCGKPTQALEGVRHLKDLQRWRSCGLAREQPFGKQLCSHVYRTPWYIKFDSCQLQAMWKMVSNVYFCDGSWMLFLQWQ